MPSAIHLLHWTILQALAPCIFCVYSTLLNRTIWRTVHKLWHGIIIVVPCPHLLEESEVFQCCAKIHYLGKVSRWPDEMTHHTISTMYHCLWLLFCRGRGHSSSSEDHLLKVKRASWWNVDASEDIWSMVFSCFEQHRTYLIMLHLLLIHWIFNAFWSSPRRISMREPHIYYSQ